jgi:hypothetical protein
VAEFSDHLKNEGRALRSHFDLRTLLFHVAVVGVFGVVVPSMRGIQFLDPVLLAPYACLGILFAAPAAAQAFVGERPGSFRQAVARIAMAVVYGELMMIAILLAGLMTVYFTRPHVLFAPNIDVLAEAGAFGLAASFALGAIAAWITLRFSETVARGALRIVFLGLLLLFAFESPRLPDLAGDAAIVSVAVALVALLGVRLALRTGL